MVVDLNDEVGVVDYVRHEAKKGLEHAIDLVRNERDTMLELVRDISDYEAEQRINNGEEFSILMVLRHLNASFDRSRQRLAAMAGGEEFTPPASAGRGGTVPEEDESSLEEARTTFRNGSDAVVDILLQADPDAPTIVTASHAQYGSFNFIEWAVYSHHVHTSDHVQQVRRIKEALRA